MDRYLALMLAHLIADFPLQAGIIYTWKISSKRGLSVHVAIHMIVMLLLFDSPSDWWPGLLALGVVHFMIDWGKLQVPLKPQALGFALDQVLHALSLVPIALYFPQMQPTLRADLIGPYILIGLLCPLLMLFWTMTFDVQEPAQGTWQNMVYLFARRRFLTASQVIGFILILLIIVGMIF